MWRLYRFHPRLLSGLVIALWFIGGAWMIYGLVAHKPQGWWPFVVIGLGTAGSFIVGGLAISSDKLWRD